jgi:hypothetical protein
MIMATRTDARERQEWQKGPEFTNLWLLLFATAGVPLFWFAQFLIGSAVAGTVCFSDLIPIIENEPNGWLRWLMVVLDAAALLASILGFVVSLNAWRGAKAAGIDARPPLDVVVSRTRFLAVWGMLTSAMFLGAIVFAAIADLVVPLCG